MHEVGIMQSTLSLAMKQAQHNGASQIHRLRLRVGAMSGVVPEALEFAFEALRLETMAAAAVLEIERVPAAGWCAACQIEFPAEDFIFECPQCRLPSAELRHGTELELVAMEIS
jgi:hydrogenase nickel incorporation protein HypA/HybF